MSRTLTPDPPRRSEERSQALAESAARGDAQARQRLLAAAPAAPADPGLRDVQLALAREYGLPGWTALREALDDLALARRSQAERVEIVLRSAWEGDRAAAMRILARWPEIRAPTSTPRSRPDIARCSNAGSPPTPRRRHARAAR